MSIPDVRHSLQEFDLYSLSLVQLRQLANANGLIALGHRGHKKSWTDPITAHAVSRSDGMILIPPSLSHLFPSRKRSRTEMESLAHGFRPDWSDPDPVVERLPKRRRISSSSSSSPSSSSTSSSSSSSPSPSSPSTSEQVEEVFSISTFTTLILRILLRPLRVSGPSPDSIDVSSLAGRQLDQLVVGILTSRGSDELKLKRLWNEIHLKLVAFGMNRLVQKWDLLRVLIEQFVSSGQISFQVVRESFSRGILDLEKLMIDLMKKHVEKRAREGVKEFLKDHPISDFRKTKKVKTQTSGGTVGETEEERSEDGEEEEEEEEVGNVDSVVFPREMVLREPVQRFVRNVYGSKSGSIHLKFEVGQEGGDPVRVHAFTWTPFSVILKAVLKRANIGTLDPGDVILRFRDREVQVDETPQVIGLKDSSRLSVALRRKSSSSQKITILVRHRDGGDVAIAMNSGTRFRGLFNAYCKKKGLRLGSVVFLFDDHALDGFMTPKSLQMEDRDIIDVVERQCGGKPVVLLYPPNRVDSLRVSSVRVRLNPEKWKVLAYYPQLEPMVDPYTVQWRSLVVDSGGNIATSPSEPSLHSVHQYLFWESVVLPSTPPFDFEASRPVYIVPTDQVCPFLLRLLLTQMRMKQKDAHNLITFWLKDFMKFPFVLLQLMSCEMYESLVELTVEPRPEVFIRVFLSFCGCTDLSRVVREPNVISDLSGVLNLPAVENLGDLPSKFVCYEWGGMNLNASRLVAKSHCIAES